MSTHRRNAPRCACIRLFGSALLLSAMLAPAVARSQDLIGPPTSPGMTATDASARDGLDSNLTSMLSRVLPATGEPTRDVNPLRVLDTVGRTIGGGGGTSSASDGESGPGAALSAPVSILLVLTLISLAPAIILMTTCFPRILIVMGILKQAIGAQGIPPPQIITSLAIFMTLLVMAPTYDRVYREAIAPWQAGEIRDLDVLWQRARQPVRDFMFDQIDATNNWNTVYMILEHRGIDTSEPERLTRADVDMVTLIPAFMLSEIKTAFLIGFRIYLPFLVIDMVISSLLISMSMMMLPPVMISLPFKLLLFVMVDGWQLVVGGLLRGFVVPGVPVLPGVSG